MPRRLLVVTTVRTDANALRDYISQHIGQSDAELKIVAPAAKVSPLQWLASDEDAAREEAGQVAAESAQAVGSEAPVETEVGDSDPVQAMEDALRTFPADEVIVLTPPGDKANWLEQDAAQQARERLGVPVRHLTYDGG
jgi:nucleotide-binding universal stress UspA family protein